MLIGLLATSAAYSQVGSLQTMQFEKIMQKKPTAAESSQAKNANISIKTTAKSPAQASINLAEVNKGHAEIDKTVPETNAADEVLPEVNVNSTSIKQNRIDKTQSITTVTAEDLQRTQPSNIFEAIRDIPGIAISGGPRPSGMTFNVRGFTDNEDVTVKVDGVFKGFEKYRFGGTFIEPELLKSIEVQRGPQIASGSGSLGGTIIATTKNAADLLAPGQSYGARAKFGYANNND